VNSGHPRNVRGHRLRRSSTSIEVSTSDTEKSLRNTFASVQAVLRVAVRRVWNLCQKGSDWHSHRSAVTVVRNSFSRRVLPYRCPGLARCRRPLGPGLRPARRGHAVPVSRQAPGLDQVGPRRAGFCDPPGPRSVAPPRCAARRPVREGPGRGRPSAGDLRPARQAASCRAARPLVRDRAGWRPAWPSPPPRAAAATHPAHPASAPAAAPLHHQPPIADRKGVRRCSETFSEHRRTPPNTHPIHPITPLRCPPGARVQGPGRGLPAGPPPPARCAPRRRPAVSRRPRPVRPRSWQAVAPAPGPPPVCPPLWASAPIRCRAPALRPRRAAVLGLSSSPGGGAVRFRPVCRPAGSTVHR
jgi:hypothetical protein